MNTGFSPRRRKTEFAKCKISGRFRVVSFQVSTTCIILVGKKHSGPPGPNSKQRRTEKMKKNHLFQGHSGAGDPGPAGPLSRPHGPHRLPQSLPHRHPHLHLPAAERAGALRGTTGKQTRCYKIAKADVAAYLRRRLAEPAYYNPAQRLVQELPGPQAPGLRP